MKALIYEGPGKKSWTEVPDPTITDPQDAIIEIDTVTICGTDLHILAGDGDRTFRLVPMTDLDAGRMWRSLRGVPLLTGYRGTPPADTGAVDAKLRLAPTGDEPDPHLRRLR